MVVGRHRFSLLVALSVSFAAVAIGHASGEKGLVLVQLGVRNEPSLATLHTICKGEVSELCFDLVVKQKSNSLMALYFQQVIEHRGGTVKSKAALQGVVPYYSGVKVTQSYARLLHELEAAPWIEWTKPSRDAKRLPEDQRAPAPSSTSAAPAAAVPSSAPVPLSSAPAAALAAERDVSLAEAARAGQAPGATDALSDLGYHKVAETRCDPQMAIFIRRVIFAHGGVITSESSFSGFVPYFSGSSAVQSYAALLAGLRKAKWIRGFSDQAASDKSISSTVCLNADGYGMVANQRNASAMELFVRRVVGSVNATIVDVKPLEEFARGHAEGKQAYSGLLLELASASWLRDFAAPISAMEFTEEGYKAVANLHKNGEMGKFVRKLVAARGGSINDSAALAAFLPAFSGKKKVQSFAALVSALSSASFVTWSTKPDATSETASASQTNVSNLSRDTNTIVSTAADTDSKPMDADSAVNVGAMNSDHAGSADVTPTIDALKEENRLNTTDNTERHEIDAIADEMNAIADGMNAAASRISAQEQTVESTLRSSQDDAREAEAGTEEGTEEEEEEEEEEKGNVDDTEMLATESAAEVPVEDAEQVLEAATDIFEREEVLSA
eukprot:TRINITY_DN41962_c0_g1_i1.p1 TRINITY_DN41962_c0_g1~~TRINITY_DN41962_c0_g1_i1.p1  ORF type:complete len:615 (-),score=107.78 TRINITY_DN41962_c0_g1_i1:189-2033(-)